MQEGVNDVQEKEAAGLAGKKWRRENLMISLEKYL